jgi:multidrug efflux pump subunit AcrA (membrane-fusion protein)
VVAVLGLAAWVFRAPLQSALDAVQLPQVRVMQVVESHPASAGAVRGTAANGHLVAARRAALSADTPGRIVELNVTEGSRVRRGDVVARLYSDEYAASLRLAEAELATALVRQQRAAAAVAEARAELEQLERSRDAADQEVAEAEAQAALAAAELARAEALRARDAAAQAALDAARAAGDAAAAQRRAASARAGAAAAAVALAEVRVEAARIDEQAAAAAVEERRAARDLAAATLAKTAVRAPFDGVVVLKDAEVGEVVSPNSQSGSNARGSVCTMVDLDSLEAQAEVPETALAAVVVGGAATIYLDAYPDRAYSGRVDRIWPTANRQKATVEVRVRLLEPDERLRPEMGLRLVFHPPGEPSPAERAAPPPAAEAAAAAAGRAGAAPAILVPQEAVVRIDGRDGVFVLERDVVRFTALELGERRSGRVSVRSGLEPGQRIVVDPPLTLRSGDRVRAARE